MRAAIPSLPLPRRLLATPLNHVGILSRVGRSTTDGVVLSPMYPQSADPAPATPFGTTGIELLAQDGVPWSGNRIPSHRVVLTAGFHTPQPVTGRVLSPATDGAFRITVEEATTTEPGREPGPSFYYANHRGAWVESAYSAPVGHKYADAWFALDRHGSRTFHLDFTTLPGGVLPSGTVFAANDVDVASEVADRVTFASPGAGAWMEYYAVMGTGDVAVVTFDEATSTYAATSESRRGYTGMSLAFRTTRPVTDVDVTLRGAEPLDGGSVWWSMFLPVVPDRPTAVPSHRSPA